MLESPAQEHMIRALFVFGTRPETVKLAPLIRAMSEDSAHFATRICVTGQHRQLLDQMLRFFALQPHHDLNLMKPNQGLPELTSAILTQLPSVIQKEDPNLIVVQGDTTTAFAAGLAAFYANVPIAHVEAGLRTSDLRSPFPEEGNRRLLTTLATFHFAPTERARQNLLSESVPPNSIHVTGNTGIDALKYVLGRLDTDKELGQDIARSFGFLSAAYRLILVTGHRRENFGEGLANICGALQRLVQVNNDVEVLWPMHLNPHVQKTVRRILGIHGSDGPKRIHLVDPVDYVPFIYLMRRSYLIVTDSGGVQEEAPSLGKPVLVTRTTTERPEAIEAGSAVLVGTDPDKIGGTVTRLLKDPGYYAEMSQVHNPFGDGTASKRIIDILKGAPK